MGMAGIGSQIVFDADLAPLPIVILDDAMCKEIDKSSSVLWRLFTAIRWEVTEKEVTTQERVVQSARRGP